LPETWTEKLIPKKVDAIDLGTVKAKLSPVALLVVVCLI